LDPAEDLPSRALLWLHSQPANSHIPSTKKLSIRRPARYHRFPWGGYVLLCLLILINHFVSVMELVGGLGDSDDAYKRKVKKGAHCVYISDVLAFLILTLLALDERLKCFPPAASPSELIHSSH
jgi:hypothetical protein